MQRQFFSNLAFLLFVNLLIKPIYIFGIDRTVQVTVSEGVYGFYFALYNFSLLFYILLDLGLTQYNTRNIARHPEKLQGAIPNFIIAKSGLGVLYLMVLFIGAYWNGYNEQGYYFLSLLGLNQILISFIFYCRSNLTALHYFKLDALLSILDRSLLIIICAILLWGNIVPRFKIEYFILAQTLTYAIAAIIGAMIIFNYTRFQFDRIDIKQISKILKESYPLALLVFLTTIFTRVDAVMLERILSDGWIETEIYAASYRLLDAINIIGLLFATILLPMFSKMLEQRKNVQNLVIESFQFIFFISYSAAIMILFYKENIVELLYGEKYSIKYTAQIMGLLMFTFIPISGNYIFNTLLNANLNLKSLNGLAFFGLVLNVCLNIYLIPEYKALGATIATLITQFLVFILHILLAYYYLKIIFPIKKIVFSIFFIITSIVVTYYSLFMFNNWIFNFLLAGFGLLVVGFLLKMINWKILHSKH